MSDSSKERAIHHLKTILHKLDDFAAMLRGFEIALSCRKIEAYNSGELELTARMLKNDVESAIKFTENINETSRPAEVSLD